MRRSQILIPTQKESPNDAQIISHQLMIRAGMITKLASGLYSYLPLGLKVLRKIENIIRQEMNKIGAQEILMPIMQPAELWQETKRWHKYGAELLRLKDRQQRDFCLAPTHEEVITDLVRKYLRSYKQLPQNFYQIYTKFRDEIRPRFGVIRAREFIMKDAYSFHLNQKSMQVEFNKMHNAYINIFNKIGLNFRAVLADNGSIGGQNSIEFHVMATSGEDEICFSDNSDYAANIERVEFSVIGKAKGSAKVNEIDTPNIKNIKDLTKFLQISLDNIIKTIIVKDTKDKFIAIALRADHEINNLKLNKVIGDFTFANDKEIIHLDLPIGFIGIKDLKIPLIIDFSAENSVDFVCGANIKDKHLTGVNWDGIDYQAKDLRSAVAGDVSPCGKGKLIIKRGIEIGHIFQLGDTYTKAMNAGVISENGKQKIMQMGCYGIGVSRIIAAIIEQNFDNNGIIFPANISPFQLIIIPINYHKSVRVKNMADDLYNKFIDNNIDVLLDDRKERVGIMLKDSDLIGILHRIVISDTHVDNNSVEYKARNTSDKVEVKLNNIIKFIQHKV